MFIETFNKNIYKHVSGTNVNLEMPNYCHMLQQHVYNVSRNCFIPYQPRMLLTLCKIHNETLICNVQLI